MKYRLKTVSTFEAWQYIKGEPIPVWVARKAHLLGDGDKMTVNVLGNLIEAKHGDWFVMESTEPELVTVCSDEDFQKEFESLVIGETMDALIENGCKAAPDSREVPKWMLRLIAEFLREYSERLGNDGCNDWEPPAWLDLKQLEAVAKEQMGSEFDPYQMRMNFAVCDVLSEAIDPVEIPDKPF